jgi:hypothetical protein
MATEAPAAAGRRIRIELGLDVRAALLAAVLVAQAIWLAVVMLPGWYSGPDLGNLGAATGRALDREYLTASLGGHFGAPNRLLYWVLNRVSPLGWELTVLLRLVVQATATYLLWRLLESLVGRRRTVPAVVALYAVSPLLVPATAVLSNGIHLAVAQACLLGALVLHVRYTRGGRLRDAVTAGALVLVALAFADQAALLVLLFPLLSLGFLHQGPITDRVRAAARHWPGWVALVAAGIGFLGLYLSGDYTGQSRRFGGRDAWQVVRETWTDVLGPALLGGPWDWSTRPDEWVSYASPPTVQVVLGQLVLVALVVLSVRRTGPRALLGWSVPVVTALGTALLIGYGRFDFLGTLVAPILRYSYFTAMALAIGVTLAFCRTTEELAGRERQHAAARTSRRRDRAVAAALVAVGAASIWSGLVFANRFWDNPAQAYVENLVASTREAGPAVELYDSMLPNGVVPGLVPNRFVSDVLALADVPAVFGGAAAYPLLAGPDGQLVPARFMAVAGALGPTSEGCGRYLEGAGSTTIRFAPVNQSGDWFLQLQGYQGRDNTLTIEVRDAEGGELAVRGGEPTIRPSGTLFAVHRRLEFGRPASMTLTSTDTATSLCLVQARIGAPFPTVGR